MAGFSSDTDSGDRTKALKALSGRHGYLLLAAALSAFFIWTVFEGAGGLIVSKNTTIWLVALPLAALLTALSVIKRGLARLNGGFVLLAAALFTLLVAASIAWSLIPSATWLEFNRTFAYLAVFTAGIALARLRRESWVALLWAMLLTVTVVVVYALLAKAVPGWLTPDETFARLRAPFNYWNAVGLCAAFGVLLSLWLGTTSDVNRLIRAAALPILGLCMVALLLSYSRGALLVAVLGTAAWFALIAPLRLKSLAVLGPAVVVAGAVVIWAFSQPDLTQDNVPLPARKDAGFELGLILLALTAILYRVGIAIDWYRKNRPLSPKAQATAGRAALGLVAVIPVVFVIGLAASEKGLGGSIESAWHSMTSEEATTPANDPSRFSSTASVRSRYWREAGHIWSNHRLVGAGAGSYEQVRKRYRKTPVTVAHAHGQDLQTLADLGLAGALLWVLAGVAWLTAAGRTLELRRGIGGRTWNAERVGAAALTIVVLMFSLHSAIDWTWYVPGVILPVLLSAGWIAGRGALSQELKIAPPGGRAQLLQRLAVASLVVAVAAVAVWAIAQPLRSNNKVEMALELAEKGEFTKAASEARKAHRIDRTSVEPFFALSSIERESGNLRGGLDPLQQAVRLQPANPEAWERLGNYLLLDIGRPAFALRVLRRAVFLDPVDVGVTQSFLKAEQAVEIQRLRREEAKKKLERARRKREKAKREARKKQRAATQGTTNIVPAQPLP